MKAKNETELLDESILLLKSKKETELILLKEQFHATYESLRPVNLIKKAFSDVTSSSTIKSNLLGNVLGVGIGILSKKLVIGNTHNPLKKLIGIALEFAVAKVVSKNSQEIKSTGENLIQRFIRNRKEARAKHHADYR
jgi:hypothetical protein